VEGDDATGYSVWFPDLDGCTSAGATTEEALRSAEDGLALHVRGMLEDGEVLPESSSVELAVEAARGYGYAAVALVPVVVPNPPRRINITMAKDLLQQVDAAAKARGMTRSGFLAEGARKLMGEGAVPRQ